MATKREWYFVKQLIQCSLTLSSPSFFDVAQSKGGGGADSPPPLHNFLSFNPNLIKPSAIDHWCMLYLLVVMYCT